MTHAQAPGRSASGHTFPGRSRLKRRVQFLRTQDAGARLWGKRFIYYVRPGRASCARLGVTVSKKVGNAVVRNRIKRWVREVFRQHPHLFPTPIDLVVIAKRDVDGFCYAAIRDELVHVITRYYQDPGAHRRSGRANSRRGHSRRGSRKGRAGGAGSGGSGGAHGAGGDR